MFFSSFCVFHMLLVLSFPCIRAHMRAWLVFLVLFLISFACTGAGDGVASCSVSYTAIPVPGPAVAGTTSRSFCLSVFLSCFLACFLLSCLLAWVLYFVLTCSPLSPPTPPPTVVFCFHFFRLAL